MMVILMTAHPDHKVDEFDYEYDELHDLFRVSYGDYDDGDGNDNDKDDDDYNDDD